MVRQCPANYHRCTNHRCIDASQVCDGIQQCGDSTNSDEAACTCTENQFKCKSGQCIPLSGRCDGDPECPDISDEMKCNKSHCSMIDPQMIRCENTTSCYLPSWICDGENDCWDGSDEQNCPAKTCNHAQYTCGDGQCINLSWRYSYKHVALKIYVCKLIHNDILTDAMVKPIVLMVPMKEDAQMAVVSQISIVAKVVNVFHHFGCVMVMIEDILLEKKTKLQYLPISFLLGNYDCKDGSDETTHCKNKECIDNFKCNQSGYCIDKKYRCDGDRDCPNNEDELDCDAYVAPNSCDELDYQCRSGQCIDRKCLLLNLLCENHRFAIILNCLNL